MLIVETIAKIRRYHFAEGKTIKQIFRGLRISVSKQSACLSDRQVKVSSPVARVTVTPCSPIETTSFADPLPEWHHLRCGGLPDACPFPSL